jgi:hypothetical protein
LWRICFVGFSRLVADFCVQIKRPPLTKVWQ